MNILGDEHNEILWKLKYYYHDKDTPSEEMVKKHLIDVEFMDAEKASITAHLFCTLSD